jgi:magnesium transporter
MDVNRKPWETLEKLIATNEADRVLAFLDSIRAAETALAISRLSPEIQLRLFNLLSPADAAEVIEDLSETQAADLVEDLPPRQAAAILEELDSDHKVDVLGEIDQKSAAAILAQMTPAEAHEARQFLRYPSESAGGIMISEFLAYRQDQQLGDVLDDLQRHSEAYADYDVQYLYVTDAQSRLVGVLRMRDLLFVARDTPLAQIMIADPLRLPVSAGLRELRNFFEDHKFFGVPVVDYDNRLVGVVLPEDVQEAARKRSIRQFLGFSGIVGGEEFRSMPLPVRAGRRLSWLTLNILLNILSASVIAIYQDTLAAAIALAVFLPMVSDMSGCSGNQAVAVSLRELSLGLIRPTEFWRVLGKEASLGVVNGVILGLLLGVVAWLWKGNAFLGLVVGGALAANTLVAVSLGGFLPLLLKRLKLDPALISSPLLTTVTDMCGFFLIFSLATLILPQLSGS